MEHCPVQRAHTHTHKETWLFRQPKGKNDEFTKAVDEAIV